MATDVLNSGVLNEAYERLHVAGPEWGEDTLTNHGPMAVEAMVRHGYDGRVHRWLDRYVRRLDDLPPATGVIGPDEWQKALGDGCRVSDWTAYFTREVAEHPWRDVLTTWWPRLLPGIVAGATHGPIRVGHAVRVLLDTGVGSGPAVTELAHALGFWAARWRKVPGAGPVLAVPDDERAPGPSAAPRWDARAALRALPRVPNQAGPVADRLAQLPALPGWAGILAGPAAVRAPDEARDALRSLVAAGTAAYLDHGHASPVLLVHVATAPNAVLRTVPALPPQLWAPTLSAVWAACAAITASYAPAVPADRSALPAASTDPVAVLERAVEHGDEHVMKLADTAAEVFDRTADGDALAAAIRVRDLIPAP